MMEYFITKEEAEEILRLLKREWSCFDELQSEIMGITKEKTMFIMQALYKLLEEERSNDHEVQEAWAKYTGRRPIRLSELERKIEEFCSKYGISKERFMRWWEGRTRLVAREGLDTDRLMKLANYYALAYILQRTHTLTMVFPRELEGRMAREIKFRAMLIGADVEFGTNDKFWVTIRIGNRTPEIMAGLAEYAERIIAEGIYGRLEIVGIPISGEYEWEEYDSHIERILSQVLTGMGARVRREPQAIILGDTIFVPDFSVEYGDRKIFVEVVGYWRRSYLINKEIKIRRAIEKGIRIIIVVNKRYADLFSHIPTPIITYEKPEDLVYVCKRIIEILERP